TQVRPRRPLPQLPEPEHAFSHHGAGHDPSPGHRDRKHPPGPAGAVVELYARVPVSVDDQHVEPRAVRLHAERLHDDDLLVILRGMILRSSMRRALLTAPVLAIPPLSP